MSSPPTRRCWRRHGTELARLAEKHGVALNFEAAVAGGIPDHQDACAKSLAANQIRRVYGILNGTCNYILTQMQEEHRSFADVLKEAQAKGYAEADPTFDIGGFDTAHKLALADEPGLRHPRRLRPDPHRRHREHHAGRYRGRRRPRLSHQAAGRRAHDRERHRAARASGHGADSIPPSPRSPASPTAWPSMAISPATCCSSAAAPAPRPPPRRSPATSSTSRAAPACRRSWCRPASSSPTSARRLGQHQGAYYVRLSVFDRPGAMAGIAGRLGERESLARKHRAAAPARLADRHRREAQAGCADTGHPHHA